MLKFSPANTKIKELCKVSDIARYLNGKRVYSLDLLSGWTCPFAKECKSKVHVVDNKKVIKDGPHTKFRCFSASQEVVFTGVYNLREHNTKLLEKESNDLGIFNLLLKSMPKDLGVLRFHVGGDFYNKNYFYAATQLALNNPDKLFYFYTKSLPYWIYYRDILDSIPNIVPTASYGGSHDKLIKEEKLRYAKVVFSEEEAGKLKIDHTDECAANPKLKKKDFALLIHGIQPANSDASNAIKILKKNKVKFSYGK